MAVFQKGNYRVRLADGSKDLQASQKLRFQVFRGGHGTGGLDQDSYDKAAAHVVIEQVKTGRVVCCFRLLLLANGTRIGRSYSAQYYDLSRLRRFEKPMVEMGRFCIDAEFQDADILRLAWGFLARFVTENQIEMLFGCSSFQGVNTDIYHDTFAFLGRKYLAPMHWRPKAKAAQIHCFTKIPHSHDPDFRLAMKGLPPLLRTYLAMGGRVSDHAVIDAELNTLHVFTGLKVRDIPAARVKVLTAIF